VLDSLPASAVEAFSGVSNVSMFAALEPDSTVLDLGCGAGLDSLIAAQRVGPGGRVVGIDFSKAMLERAKHAARSAPINNITVLSAAAEKLPLADATIDTALVNGVFNLNPERADIFAELARVIRPGGTAYAAELILKEPLPSEVRQDEASWFA
jgi:ubiquinone/menaquinone biosynthesis C-methylase UbiE